MRKTLLTIITILCYANTVLAQGRIKVILDNDFAGDPDGLFALAQLVESPSVDIRAIIGSHLHQGENWTAKGKPSATTAVENANTLLSMMGKEGKYKVAEGSNTALCDTRTPIRTAATDVIIKEAMECSPRNPLYVLCGGGLTEIASAWMLNKDIVRRIILVWIGGAEYPGHTPPPGAKLEYNTTIDTKAAQVIFNQSDISLWQIPRNAYRQCLISRSVLRARTTGNNSMTKQKGTEAKRKSSVAKQKEFVVKQKSSVAEYLLSLLDSHIGPDKPAECYVLGDSPLVLISALQSNWERDACSSGYSFQPRPTVNDKGEYNFGDTKRSAVKVFDRLDTYLMFEDMFAKLNLPQ